MIKTELTLWDCVKFLYNKKFNMPLIVVEYIAVFDILTLFTMGYSNDSIVTMLSLPEDYIVETLKIFLDSSGWKDDLDCVPYTCYIKSKGDSVVFENLLMLVSNTIKYKECMFIYNLCRKFDKIRMDINKYYV